MLNHLFSASAQNLVIPSHLPNTDEYCFKFGGLFSFGCTGFGQDTLPRIKWAPEAAFAHFAQHHITVHKTTLVETTGSEFTLPRIDAVAPSSG